MSLEYNLSNIGEAEQLNDLKLELAPRCKCRVFVATRGGRATLTSKKEFDSYFEKHEFSEGPYKDDFGDGRHEPYNPNRQAFGILKNGEAVYCELSEAFIKKTEELFKLIKQ